MPEIIPTPMYAMPDDSYALGPDGSTVTVGRWLDPATRSINGHPTRVDGSAVIPRLVFSERERAEIEVRALATIFTIFPDTQIITEAAP